MCQSTRCHPNGEKGGILEIEEHLDETKQTSVLDRDEINSADSRTAREQPPLYTHPILRTTTCGMVRIAASS